MLRRPWLCLALAFPLGALSWVLGSIALAGTCNGGADDEQQMCNGLSVLFGFGFGLVGLSVGCILTIVAALRARSAQREAGGSGARPMVPAALAALLSLPGLVAGVALLLMLVSS